MMHMAGFFPSVPSQVNFELMFAPVDGQWRLFGISVSFGQAAPAAPEPPCATQPPAAKLPAPESPRRHQAYAAKADDNSSPNSRTHRAMLPISALKSMNVLFATPCYISAVTMNYVASIFSMACERCISASAASCICIRRV